MSKLAINIKTLKHEVLMSELFNGYYVSDAEMDYAGKATQAIADKIAYHGIEHDQITEWVTEELFFSGPQVPGLWYAMGSVHQDLADEALQMMATPENLDAVIRLAMTLYVHAIYEVVHAELTKADASNGNYTIAAKGADGSLVVICEVTRNDFA